MVYLPRFGCFLMVKILLNVGVNIPYMDGIGMGFFFMIMMVLFKSFLQQHKT